MDHSNNRWLTYGTSIFSKMSLLSAEVGAVNLSQGFPDVDGPDDIKEAACRAIWDGRNQYAPSAGLLPLREKVAEYRRLRSQTAYCPTDETTIFSGATEALWAAFLGVCGRGDEVVVLTPFYDSYRPAIEAAGAQIREVELEPPDFAIVEKQLRAAICEKSKVLVLNHPHNPTGRVFSQDELQTVASIVEEFDLTVITDEVYEELCFDGTAYHYFANLDGMKARTIAISSTSKTFSFTGWKIGFAFAPKVLTDIIRSVHQSTVFCSATPLQHAMVVAFDQPASYYDALRQSYREARDQLAMALEGCGQTPYRPAGTYFILADYSAVSGDPDYEFAVQQTRRARVSCIPVSSFYLDRQAASRRQLLRYAFCKKPETIEEARLRLLAASRL